LLIVLTLIWDIQQPIIKEDYMVYVFTTPILENGKNATVDKIRRRNKWDNDDYVCRGLILKGMSDPLFNIYQNVESGKELWDSLQAKYMAEDAPSKKFLVSCIIDKLPLSWKDFKHTLKHKKELTLVELGSHLRIEESLRAQDSDKPKENNVVCPQLNIVNDIGKSAFMSTFKLNDSIIWHAKLCHVHFKRMQDMSKDGLIPAFDMETGKTELRVLGDAIFDENRFSSVPRLSLRIPNGTEDIGGSVVPEEVTEEVVQQPEPDIRKGKRNMTPKNFRPEFQLYLIEGTRDKVSD
ncbi:zinc finger, CCHC-type containing protein, partial [Tanacetum coccineum]